MEKYQCCKITGEASSLNDFEVELLDNLKGEWKKAKVGEDIEEADSLSDYVVIKYEEENSEFEAIVYIIKDSDNYKVTNIISPNNSDGLIYNKYNEILNKFYEDCVANIYRKYDLSIEFSKSEVNLEDLMGGKTANKFKEFLASPEVGKNSMPIHHYDLKRWHEFVISSFESENCMIDSNDLRRWLIEEEKFSDKITSKLLEKYEDEIELLKLYSSNK